jgi:hypothetical protein
MPAMVKRLPQSKSAAYMLAANLPVSLVFEIESIALRCGYR